MLVRRELHHGAVLFLGRPLTGVDQLAEAELSIRAHSVPVCFYKEILRQRIHGLQTHAVQTHGLLVTLGVVLTSGVQHAYSLDYGIKRNTTSEVSYDRLLFIHIDLNLLAESHGELIDGIVHYLLEQHIDTVSLIITVSESSNVHAGTLADMLHTLHRPDVVVCVICCLYNFLCHALYIMTKSCKVSQIFDFIKNALSGSSFWLVRKAV